jgi:hypothetical protein
LANAENRITRIFTGEVCLTEAGQETVCLNRTELQSLKALLASPPSGGDTPTDGQGVPVGLPAEAGGGGSSDPTPVDPAPVDPAPVDPAPIDPTPVDPAPVDPVPVDPAPVEPAPVVDPAPVEPAPTDPVPVDPAPIDPVPVDPAPAP